MIKIKKSFSTIESFFFGFIFGTVFFVSLLGHFKPIPQQSLAAAEIEAPSCVELGVQEFSIFRGPAQYDFGIQEISKLETK